MSHGNEPVKRPLGGTVTLTLGIAPKHFYQLAPGTLVDIFDRQIPVAPVSVGRKILAFDQTLSTVTLASEK